MVAVAISFHDLDASQARNPRPSFFFLDRTFYSPVLAVAFNTALVQPWCTESLFDSVFWT